MPRHRDVPFKTLVFENYRRGEAALVTAMAEMVVAPHIAEFQPKPGPVGRKAEP